MKYLIFVFICNMFTVSAFALTPCGKKQVGAAKTAMAKDYGVKKKSIVLLSIESGGWTEIVSNNTGSDDVTVVLTRADDDVVTETYRISAQQIGSTADCRILNTKKI